MEQERKSPPYFMIGIMMVGTLIAVLNNVSLNNALPMIKADLEIERYATIQWLTTVNMLISGVLIPTSAFFITKFKSNQVFITAMGIFTIGTLLAIIAPNFIILLGARVIQAAGTAILMPLLMNIMLASFSREKRGKAMGIYGLIYMLAPVIGPILSGHIVDNYGWRMIFKFIAFLAIGPLALSFWKLENILEQRETSIDFGSLSLSSISFTSLLFGFSNAGIRGWGDVSAYGLISLGLLTLGIFIYRQCKIDNPLLDLSVYRYPMFAISSAISVLLAMILYAPMVIMPFFLQNIQGHSTLQSGLISLPGTLVMAVAMPITGKWYDKIGAMPLAIVGFLMIGISSFFMSLLTIETGVAYIVSWLIVRSFGIALIIMPMQTNGLNQLPARLNASATAINGTVQQISGAIGIAVFITLKTQYTNYRFKWLSEAAMLETGYPLLPAVENELLKLAGVDAVNFTALVAASLSIVALILSLFVRKRMYQEAESSEAQLELINQQKKSETVKHNKLGNSI